MPPPEILNAIVIVILFAGGVGVLIVLLSRAIRGILDSPSAAPPSARRPPSGRASSQPSLAPGYDTFRRTVEKTQIRADVDLAILNLSAIELPGTGRGCYLEVVGESFRQSTLARAVLGSDAKEATFYLFPEIANDEDPNAVAVLSDTRHLVGYLTREDAPRYRQTLIELRGRGQIGRCSGRFVGGTDDKPYLGVWLDVVPPTHLAEHFGIAYERVRN